MSHLQRVINRRYRIMERYLSPAEGAVYRAYDDRNHKAVLVWILPESTKYRQNLAVKQIEAVATLGHPNVVDLYDHGIDERTDRLFLVFDFAEYRTLGDVMSDPGSRPIPIVWALSIITQMLAAIQAAHQIGVIHRRISPFNILLLQQHVRLTGFGLAYLLEPHPPDGVDVYYLAPEQLQNTFGDERTDLYSLGVVMFHLLTGELPFHGVNPQDLAKRIAENRPASPTVLNPELPETVGEMILKLLQYDPAQRPHDAIQSLIALLEDIRRRARSGG